MGMDLDLDGLGLSDGVAHRITKRVSELWLGPEPPHAVQPTALELAAMVGDVGLRAGPRHHHRRRFT